MYLNSLEFMIALIYLVNTPLLILYLIHLIKVGFNKENITNVLSFTLLPFASMFLCGSSTYSVIIRFVHNISPYIFGFIALLYLIILIKKLIEIKYKDK